MKSKLYIALLLIAGQQVSAQIPEDALRMSWNVPAGTARQQAIGGAMGSLGGEISSLYVNPAGLGFFKTSEIVLSPGLSLLGSKSNFRGTDASADRLTRFNFGTSGLVWGFSDKYSRWSSRAFSIGINRTANFNSTFHYKGTNDYSSFGEPLANEFFDYYVQQRNNNPGLSDGDIIDNALDAPGLSLLSKMALYTYLTDVIDDNGTSRVISRSEEAGIVLQDNKIVTRGGITEVAIGYAANMDDKLYIGGSLGIPIVNYERKTSFRESDANGSGNNEFNYTSYDETYTSKGLGVNLKLGLIFKPADFLRFGVAIHSPTLYGLKDKLTSTMTTDIDTTTGNPKVFTVNSNTFYNGEDPSFKYNLNSPWHFIVSGSYVIREISDVTKQRGFITADVEYVTYGSSRFSSADEDESGGGDYYKAVNDATKQVYKGAFNFRAGGEVKFNVIMARLGFAYYGKPYDDKALEARKMNISGGLGYRNKGIFIDLTYVHSINKDVNFPYRVDAPRFNTFAELKENTGNLFLTVGFKL
jgi:hypothetical protein